MEDFDYWRLNDDLSIIEAALLVASDTNAEQIGALISAWQASTPTTNATSLDQILAQRFERALQAQRAGGGDYLDELKSNAPLLYRELTRLEILLSLDSPPGQAAERLKLQVEVLQTALREGSQSVNHAALLAKLCALPAIVDAPNLPRFELVVGRLLNADSGGRVVAVKCASKS